MTADQRRRLRKVRIVWLALILVALAGATAIPVRVVRPVIANDGQPVLREDGSKKMESDPWGNFRVNWLSYSLAYTGVGIIAYALGSWCIAGFSGSRNKRHDQEY